MNRDELDGKAQVVKGKFKKAAGDLTDDRSLRNEGRKDEIVGKTEETVGRAERKMDEALDDIADVRDR